MLFALGREPGVPADALVAVLNTQVSVPNPLVPAFRNSRGLRLTATDADWAHGVAGPTVGAAPPIWCPCWATGPRCWSVSAAMVSTCWRRASVGT